MLSAFHMIWACLSLLFEFSSDINLARAQKGDTPESKQEIECRFVISEVYTDHTFSFQFKDGNLILYI
jgi:hypothetical protein